jgi:prepilin-type N-terminal cleavage/methylation domain-containing protein
LTSTDARGERGFTLIEVLFAMVIMTTALVALAELMAITLRMQMQGRTETAAVRLCQSKIDELVALNWTDAAITQADVGGSLTEDVENYSDDPSTEYHRRWQIAVIAGETSVRTLTVKIIPTRNDHRLTGGDIQLSTIIRSTTPVP